MVDPFIASQTNYKLNVIVIHQLVEKSVCQQASNLVLYFMIPEVLSSLRQAQNQKIKKGQFLTPFNIRRWRRLNTQSKSEIHATESFISGDCAISNDLSKINRSTESEHFKKYSCINMKATGFNCFIS